MTGVMPVIFASSIVSLLPTILMLCGINGQGKTFWDWAYRFFGSDGFVYPLAFFLLIVGFAYFYTQITFDPVDVANNLKKQGGAIPGIRQGRPTSDYIKKILNKITLAGALFLSIVAVLPVIAGPHVIQHLVEWILSGNTYYSAATVETAAKSYSSIFTFGGTSLIIVVGVALETFRELEAQLTMRNYKGFL
jgi:preprotein translocase subunit SecY